jgi:hypothetical protein
LDLLAFFDAFLFHLKNAFRLVLVSLDSCVVFVSCHSRQLTRQVFPMFVSFVKATVASENKMTHTLRCRKLPYYLLREKLTVAASFIDK